MPDNGATMSIIMNLEPRAEHSANVQRFVSTAISAHKHSHIESTHCEERHKQHRHLRTRPKKIEREKKTTNQLTN